MSIDASNPIDPAARPATAGASQPDRTQVVRLAQEFEAMLLNQMLREMRKSMVDEDDAEGGFGNSTMTDTSDAEFARALSAQGGVGLTSTLIRAFERQIAPAVSGAGSPSAATVNSSSEPVGPPARVQSRAVARPATAAAVAPTPAALTRVTGDGPVSSHFGWRNDPLTGARRFHTGVDIAMAYGRDVKAAAAGQVVFAGVQNGYGNTVVIDHGNGRQTRYAHLSDETVRAGDTVTEGQVIGKSGNSGRSTGPHLHFEMTVQGQPVDPGSVSAG